MNLPKVITHLEQAQNNFDSHAYANCFSEKTQWFSTKEKHTKEKPKSNSG